MPTTLTVMMSKTDEFGDEVLESQVLTSVFDERMKAASVFANHLDKFVDNGFLTTERTREQDDDGEGIFDEFLFVREADQAFASVSMHTF